MEIRSFCSYVGEAGVGGRLRPAVLQVVGPVEVLALVASRSLHTHAVLQTPLHRQDARRVGVTHDRPRLHVGGEVVQRHLEVDLIVDLKRKQNC